MFENFDINNLNLTKYLFFTGKGGTGKTSTACSIAVNLADRGNKVFLVSTDPASNLQDVFDMKLTNKPKEIIGIPNLKVANLDPITSANEYKDSVVAPYRGILPDSAIKNMEEQLSGSCTVEIASFNEFSHIITDIKISEEFDYIIFDTAPTGHTLRMLMLPSAWSGFIDTNKFGASCLGQLSGLGDKKQIYHNAMDMLKDKEKTTIVLLARPEETPLKEALRSFNELKQIGLNNQMLIINGILMNYDDDTSKVIYIKQRNALSNITKGFKDVKTYILPLRGYNIIGIDNIRDFINKDSYININENINISDINGLKFVVDDIEMSNKKVIFTMGKGGTGKTTIASAIALELSNRGNKVVLASTDPADHLKYVISKNINLDIIKIDEQEELEKHKSQVINKAIENNITDEDLEYIKEDLRSPCTQEIAVFKAFAKIVDKSEDSIVIIDTAPTGHTLLLLDTTQSYNKEIKRSQGDVPQEVIKLLPRLKNEKETEVIIVTLAETTPVFESIRLLEDLKRAGIYSKWWVVNSSIYLTNTTNKVLLSRANNEIKWINKVAEISDHNFAVIKWMEEDLKEDNLRKLIY
ncbi:MAG: arsenical pump-driving ATPase [Clostridia bacterium]|jgi:arsenite-transporting ATPase|nr:arsenical pump-driving ATPase [Clostridia bacterium]